MDAEARRQYRREYYRLNRDKVRAYQKQWRDKKKTEMTAAEYCEFLEKHNARQNELRRIRLAKMSPDELAEYRRVQCEKAKKYYQKAGA